MESPSPALPPELLRMDREILDSSTDFSSDDSIADPCFVPMQQKQNKLLEQLLSEQNFNEELRSLPSAVSSQSNDCPKLTRKKRRNPELWKQNVRKKLRQYGLSYKNSKGNEVPAVRMRQPCSVSCFYLCTKNITEKQRSEIHEKFWELTDTEKNNFYSSSVKKRPVNKRRPNTNSSEFKKKFSFYYFLKVKDRIIQTCKTYFLNTLGISERRIYYYFNNVHDEPNGLNNTSRRQKCGRKRTNEEQINDVKDHISSFPAVESHYCRSTSKKTYLEGHLSLSKMYQFYKEQSSNPVSFFIYKNVFNYNFNLKFFQPKKDECDKCALYKLNKNPLENDIQVFKMHKEEKALMKAERDVDRKNIDSSKAIICFDLQNVFTLPKAYVSNFYYKRKLCVFNLTATVILPRKKKVTYCAMWTEVSLAIHLFKKLTVCIVLLKNTFTIWKYKVP